MLPPQPTITSITDNPSTTGLFTVAWSAAARADQYRLEENPDRVNWNEVAVQPGRSWSRAAVETVSETTYIHTDALRSPVAETDASGAVVKRMAYTPWGVPADGIYTQGPGYTGHVTDAATGLSYMQQRYYDPVGARFVSPDPVRPDAESGANFNRYWYADDNPYKNIDPDGRDAIWVHAGDGVSTLIIPVNFTGPGATSDNIAAIRSKFNNLRHNVSGVRIQAVSTDRPIAGVLNTLDIKSGGNPQLCGSQGDCTNKVGGNRAYVNSSLDDFVGAAAHEIGHLSGMDDRYQENGVDSDGNRRVKPSDGYDNSNIMTSRYGDSLKGEQIQEARDNSSTKHCTATTGTHIKSC